METLNMDHDNFDQPIDTQNMTCQSNYPIIATERALQFKQDFENMEEMLQITNTINFDELHSESQRSSRNMETKPDYDPPNPCTIIQKQQKIAEFYKNQQISGNYQNSSSQKELKNTQGKSHKINRQMNNLIDSKIAQFNFDFNEIRKSKQINIQQALQENLRSKKQQIIELEARFIDLTQSQNVKLAKLSQFKKQREYYQQQYNLACQKRINEMETIKEQLQKIEQKIREYNSIHQQSEREINDKVQEQKAELAALQSQRDELQQEIDKLQKQDENIKVKDYEDEEPSEPLTNENYQELNQQVIEIKNKINQQKQKQLEVKNYIDKLSAFIRQSEEEQQMTQEEIDSKVMRKAELIAEREELDQMIEMGRVQGGKEFEFYLKLQEVQIETGEEGNKFVQEQYEKIKAQTFFNDIVNQMKNHPKAQEKQIYDQIETQQREVMQNIGILKTSQMIQIISYLTNELDMQINEELLLQKYESSSKQKDKIFEQKSNKLNEIQREIELYEKKIILYQNQVNNILKPQVVANQQTIISGKQRIPKLEQQLQLIEEQLKISQAELQERYSKVQISHHRLKSKKGITSLKTMITEIQQKIDVKQQKLQKLEIDQFSLEQQLDQSLSILKQKKTELMGKLQILDSYAPQLSSSKNFDDENQKTKSDQQRQDEELRQVLDNIDKKIGQIIEEKQRDGLQIQTMQKQIKEAKECFTNVYKHYKAIKKEIELHEKESLHLNKFMNQDLNTSIIPYEQQLRNMPHQLFQSDQKLGNSQGTLEQFVSFSQNSSMNTPFQKIENFMDNNPYNCNSPTQQSQSQYSSSYQSKDDKENYLSTKKSKSKSSYKMNQSFQKVYVYQDNSNSKNSQFDQFSNKRSFGNNSNNHNSLSLMKQNNSQCYDKINKQLQYAIQMNKMRETINGNSQVSFEVHNSNKKNIIALSPHLKSMSKSASKVSKSNKKSQSSKQILNQNSSSVKKIGYGICSNKSSSLLYNDDYMNEIFTNEDENESNSGVSQPRINPFMLEKVNDPPFQVQNPDLNDNLSQLNNDLNDVWASSQKNFQIDQMNSKLEARTFDYNQKTHNHTEDSPEKLLNLSKINRLREDTSQNESHNETINDKEIEKQLKITIKQPNENRNPKHRQFSLETAGFNLQIASDNNTLRSVLQNNNHNILEQEQEHENLNDSINMIGTQIVQKDDMLGGNSSKNVQINLETLKSQQNIQESEIQTPQNIENEYNNQNLEQINSCSDTRQVLTTSSIVNQQSMTNSSMVIQPPLTASSLVNQPNMTQSSTALVTHKSLQQLNLNNNQEVLIPNEEQQQSLQVDKDTMAYQGNLSDIIKSLQNLSQIQSQQRHPQTQPTQQSVTKSNRSSQLTTFPEMIPHRKNNQLNTQSNQNVQRQSFENRQHVMQAHPVNQSFNMRQNLSHNDLMTSQNFSYPQRPVTQMSAQQLNSIQKQINIDYSSASLPTTHHVQASTPKKNVKRSSVNPNNRSQMSIFTQNSKSNHKLQVSPNNKGQTFYTKRNSVNFLQSPMQYNNELLPTLLPMLQGAIFYKKFSSRTSMKSNAKTFDPLKANKVPPEQCGYGIRFIQLDTSLKFVNIRQHLKNSNEVQIPISDILKPIIPSITMEIIKAKKSVQSQKKEIKRSESQLKDFSNQKNQGDLMDSLSKEHKDLSISHLVKMGVVDKNSQAFKDRCKDCAYFPFSIALKEITRDSSSKRIILGDNITSSTISSGKEQLDGQIELIATSYESLKAWTLGINMLLKQQDQISKSQNGQQFE